MKLLKAFAVFLLAFMFFLQHHVLVIFVVMKKYQKLKQN